MIKVALCVGFSLAAIGLLVVGAVLAGLLPLFPLPEPAGLYPVGTAVRTIHLATPIRVELWYPAQKVGDARRARYHFADSASAPFRSRFIWSLIRTDSYIDAGIANGKFPVLLYVPSWGSTRADNTGLVQSLASHGFIVVAMDDLFPERPLALSSAEVYRSSLRWGDEKVRLEAAAAQEVLDALVSWNTADPDKRFTSHLLLEHVGIVGFSFGGAVAAELACVDSRVAAAVDMDGWLFGDALEHGVPKPFLMFGSAGPPFAKGNDVTPDQYYAALLDRIDGEKIRAGLQKYGGFVLTIANTEHLNYSDVAFYPSLRRTGLGSIDGRRAARIVVTYLEQFFDRALSGRAAPLFDVKTRRSQPKEADAAVPDAAVHFEVWPAPRARVICLFQILSGLCWSGRQSSAA